jgi:ADP-ribose pyrophosphatase YjhB (NUDIX family)
MATPTPKRIEAVTRIAVQNDEGAILLCRCPKLKNAWTLPGGSLQPGEPLRKAAIRIAKEEVNLNIHPIAVIRSGEMLNPKELSRAFHGIYFGYLCGLQRGKVAPNEKAYDMYAWFQPAKALTLQLESITKEVLQTLTVRKSR